MVVAVAVMGVMKSPIDQVADMIAMGDGFVAAAWTVDMAWLVAQHAVRHRGAGRGVHVGNLDHMLVVMVFMRMMQMAVMEVIHMIAVAHRRVPAAWAVHMRMVFVLGVVAGHPVPPIGLA